MGVNWFFQTVSRCSFTATSEARFKPSTILSILWHETPSILPTVSVHTHNSFSVSFPPLIDPLTTPMKMALAVAGFANSARAR